MAQIKSQKPVAHIYTFAFMWLLSALAGNPIHSVMDFAATAIISFSASTIVYLALSFIRKLKNRGGNVSARDMEEPVMETASTNNPELDAVVSESRLLLEELESAKLRIRSRDIARKTDEIIDISHKIIEKLRRQPQLLSSARRFFNYYLPTTTKLITNYSYMESQGVSGGNISNTMQKIENSLDNVSNAYRAQLDTLFSNTAIDLETDIDALENILKQEGLMQNNFKGE